MNYITFNGQRSDQLGIYVSTFPNYSYPEKNIESISIPGRNGDIILDSGTYKNVDVSYSVSIYQPMYGESAITYASIKDRMIAITKWLHPDKLGYCELSDTYYPGYYRLAICKNAGEVENLLNTVGRATIRFNCRPERFKASTSWTTYNQNNSYVNITSDPVCNNTIAAFDIQTIANTAVTFDVQCPNSNYDSAFQISSGDSIIIDGDTLTPNVAGAESRILRATAMPRLTPGQNKIRVTSGSVKVRPRWWIL